MYEIIVINKYYDFILFKHLRVLFFKIESIIKKLAPKFNFKVKKTGQKGNADG